MQGARDVAFRPPASAVATGPALLVLTPSFSAEADVETPGGLRRGRERSRCPWQEVILHVRVSTER